MKLLTKLSPFILSLLLITILNISAHAQTIKLNTNENINLAQFEDKKFNFENTNNPSLQDIFKQNSTLQVEITNFAGTRFELAPIQDSMQVAESTEINANGTITLDYSTAGPNFDGTFGISIVTLPGPVVATLNIMTPDVNFNPPNIPSEDPNEPPNGMPPIGPPPDGAAGPPDVISPPPISEEDDDGFGGVAKCKFKGGDKKFKKRVTLRDNAFLFDTDELFVDIEFADEFEGMTSYFRVEILGELENTSPNLLTSKSTIKPDESIPELFLTFDGRNDRFALIALGQQQTANEKPNIILKINKVKKEKASGILKMTYPQTLLLSLDDFESIANQIENDEIVSLEDLKGATTTGEDNGTITVICKFKNIPVIDATGLGDL